MQLLVLKGASAIQLAVQAPWQGGNKDTRVDTIQLEPTVPPEHGLQPQLQSPGSVACCRRQTERTDLQSLLIPADLRPNHDLLPGDSGQLAVQPGINFPRAQAGGSSQLLKYHLAGVDRVKRLPGKPVQRQLDVCLKFIAPVRCAAEGELTGRLVGNRQHQRQLIDTDGCRQCAQGQVNLAVRGGQAGIGLQRVTVFQVALQLKREPLKRQRLRKAAQRQEVLATPVQADRITCLKQVCLEIQLTREIATAIGLQLQLTQIAARHEPHTPVTLIDRRQRQLRIQLKRPVILHPHIPVQSPAQIRPLTAERLHDQFVIACKGNQVEIPQQGRLAIQRQGAQMEPTDLQRDRQLHLGQGQNGRPLGRFTGTGYDADLVCRQTINTQRRTEQAGGAPLHCQPINADVEAIVLPAHAAERPATPEVALLEGQ